MKYPEEEKKSTVRFANWRLYSPALMLCLGVELMLGRLVCSVGAEAAAVTNKLSGKATSPPAKAVMPSSVFEWKEMKGKGSDVAVYRDVFDNPTATLDKFSCHVMTLFPGKEPHPPHKHLEEELIIVKEGALEVTLKGVTNKVTAGGMIFCASNELHGWRNTSSEPATYYVLKVYPRDIQKKGAEPGPK